MLLEPAVVAELADHYTKGRSFKDLAARYSLSYSAVRDALIGANVEIRPPGPRLPATPPGMVNAYNNGRTIHQVAAMYGMSYGQTRRVLLAEGVQIRGRGAAS
ncbi:helix-turn-helix domain-containing protein [Amycolatopsis roodepoortensis]|uniref:helix-turn-helix domain-containing protein n=1 Tax=Amycolatopsis roodepoortensis TaxID=700274 RepID=UPI0036150507